MLCLDPGQAGRVLFIAPQERVLKGRLTGKQAWTT